MYRTCIAEVGVESGLKGQWHWHGSCMGEDQEQGSVGQAHVAGSRM
jgi:hypothetical protein